ncbi:tetratricopeptide repeat protein [Kribbella sp. NPDC026611]|uniref:tetratricopeptide repeat protein n=1 Tax=Kribbella sp. NPDC026611 TaxID=3154911 RepID=UPI0033F15D94
MSELLRRLRIRAGLTQAALAERAGLSEQAISVLERGTRSRPRQDTVRALTKALDLSPAEADQFLTVARGKRDRPGPAANAPTAAAIPAPWQLPPAVPDFTGRAAQMDAILAVLRTSKGVPNAAVGLVAVTGMGGIGKTALAVQAAHTLTDSYPDGHLYLNLRGYGPGRPMTSTEALQQLLRSLGLDVQLIPDGVDEAAALLRSKLAGRRVLILLDNATDVRHVLPLLPGSPGSAAIITSRGSMADLPGARQIRLDALSDTEAVELLAGVIGRDRVAAEPAAAESLALFTGRLPLAVRLIGGRLAARPHWPVQHLVELLSDEERRLDTFGSDETGVRASIASSVRFLDSSDRDVDRAAVGVLPLLSVPDGADLHVVVAAALLDLPVRRTAAILERLVDLNLLESAAPERYRFHDLIRAYARELAEEKLTPEERDAGLARMIRFYTGFAWAAQSLTHATSPRLALATVSIEPLPVLSSSSTALRWLDDEQRNLMDRFHQAETSSLADSTLLSELSLALFGYGEARGRWSVMRALARGSVERAEQAGLLTMAAWLQHDRAIPDVEIGDLEPARLQLLRALEMFRATGDLIGQARCCSSISHVLEREGKADEALAMINEALQLSRDLPGSPIEGVTYLALGALLNRLGRFGEADKAFAQSLALATGPQDKRSLAKRYLNAGISHVAVGRFADAIEPLRKGSDASAGIGDGIGQAETEEVLAMAFAAQGEFGQAEEHARAGLTLARAFGHGLREGRLLLQLARIAAAAGEPAQAEAFLADALPILHVASAKVEREALEFAEQISAAGTFDYVPNLP